MYVFGDVKVINVDVLDAEKRISVMLEGPFEE
jgi:hypothetical protein